MLILNLASTGPYEGTIFSLTFLGAVPIVIGLIPLFFADNSVLTDWRKRTLLPMLSVLVFFILAYATRLEDLFCILVLAQPLMLIAAISGLFLGGFLKKRIEKKSRKIYSILLLPFLLNTAEPLIPEQVQSYSTQASIEIAATAPEVWTLLIEVPTITQDEYKPGLFNRLGVPRPLHAKLEIKAGETYRMGYFTDDLLLCESISHVDSLHLLVFDIHMDQSQFRDKPTYQHVLNSGIFRFDAISYSLEALADDRTTLTLSCNYSIESGLNWYAAFWADQLLSDFEKRLLAALKLKAELL